MLARNLTTKLIELSRQYPVLTVTGPRRSGKTTLIRSVFPDMTYISLEDPDTRLLMERDPRSVLERGSEGMIIDEAQNVPELFSYVQGIVDRSNVPGQFILSGSQSFTLHSKISQSLAGRTAILRLLPFTLDEARGSMADRPDLETVLHMGFYPEVLALKRNPVDYYSNYLQTYVERDVRQLRNIGNLSLFIRFVMLCAGRIGQLVDYSSLAGDAGVSVNTAKAWLSVLEASYIVILIPPHYKNFSKRLIKAPKIYFLDTGLACSLLNIEHPDQLKSHYLRGGLFENLIVVELLKRQYNKGRPSNLYFWRDHRGHEVDVIIEGPQGLQAVECKSGKTFNPDFFTGIDYLQKISGNTIIDPVLVYGGEEQIKLSNGRLLPWNKVDEV